MIKTALGIIGIIALVALSGCIGSSLNSNPPDYIKQVSAIKDGNGLQIYFVLADKEGAMTTADGKFVLQITQDDKKLYQSLPVNVTKGDFQKRSAAWICDCLATDIRIRFRLPISRITRPRTASRGIIPMAARNNCSTRPTYYRPMLRIGTNNDYCGSATARQPIPEFASDRR